MLIVSEAIAIGFDWVAFDKEVKDVTERGLSFAKRAKKYVAKSSKLMRRAQEKYDEWLFAKGAKDVSEITLMRKEVDFITLVFKLVDCKFEVTPEDYGISYRGFEDWGICDRVCGEIDKEFIPSHSENESRDSAIKCLFERQEIFNNRLVSFLDELSLSVTRVEVLYREVLTMKESSNVIIGLLDKHVEELKELMKISYKKKMLLWNEDFNNTFMSRVM